MGRGWWLYIAVCKGGGECVRGCLVAQFLPRQVYIDLSHWPLVYISDCDWPCWCEGKPMKPQFVCVNL